MKNYYRCDTAQSFRKATGMPEKKCSKVITFVDFSALDKMEIPEQIKETVKDYYMKHFDRLNRFILSDAIPSEETGLFYNVDMDGHAYNVYNNDSGKLLYTVACPDRIRISTHKANMYGFMGEYIGTIEQNWQHSFTSFYDL